MTATPIASSSVRSASRGAPFVAERAARWLPWLATVLTLLAAVHAIEPLPVGVFYDDAQYLVLAKSLATGAGYRFLNLPGAPAATHFPPGYPAFLALLWRVAPSFPENVALFKFANALLLGGVAMLTCLFAQRTLGLPRTIASIAAVAGAATIPLLVLSSAIMSEPLFLALLFPLLIWAERATGADVPRTRIRDAILIGAASGALALVRTHGIALGAAVIIRYAQRRRWREAVACAAAVAVVLLPWALWVRLHDDALTPLVRGAYGSYVGWFAAGWLAEGVHLLVGTLPDNVATLWMTIVRSIVPGGHPLAEIMVGGVYVALTAIGIERCWHCARVMSLFLAGYVAIVLVWPFSPLRFFWGIWPLLMVLPAAGLVSVWESPLVRRHRAWRGLVIASAATLVAGIAAFNVTGYANAWWSSNARYHARRVLPALAWVARSTQPGDVVAADAEAAVYLYTGRRAVPVTTFTAAEYVRERTLDDETRVVSSLLQEYQPRYVLVTSRRLRDALTRAALQAPDRIVRVDSLGEGAVFGLSRCTKFAGRMDSKDCE